MTDRLERFDLKKRTKTTEHYAFKNPLIGHYLNGTPVVYILPHTCHMPSLLMLKSHTEQINK